MIPLPGLWCIRCRGMAYDDDDALACMICGRTLAVRPPRSLPFRTVKIQQDEERRKLGMIRYPPELKAIALGWLLEGESAEDVAGVTGLSIETLRTWRTREKKRLGIPMRDSYSEEFRAECVARLRAGETTVALSAETGISVDLLGHWRRAAEEAESRASVLR